MQPSFHEALALEQLGDLAISQLPELAIEWLIAGLESEHLILLAGESEYNDRSELRELFHTTAQELGIRIPTYPEVLCWKVYIVAMEVVRGQQPAETGAIALAELKDLGANCGGEALTSVARIHYLYDAQRYYGMDAEECKRREAEIDREVFRECKEIVENMSECWAVGA